MNDTTSDKIDGMLDFNGMTSISGLAFMQGVRDGTLPPAPIADTLNFTLYLVEEGRIIFRGTPGGMAPYWTAPWPAQ
jgi:hypothetical protein